MIFLISLLNSMAFMVQKLVLWEWFNRAVFISLFAAFFSGFFVTYLNDFQIRFLLWCFLALILSLPWLLKTISFFKKQGFYVFSFLMGFCAGGTGLGGGMILAPYLYESNKIPVKNIPALISCIMFFVSSSSLIGQITHLGVSFIYAPLWQMCFFVLFIPSLIGLCFGYIANVRQHNIKWRRWFLRFMAGSMFLKLTWELFDMVF